MKRADLEEAIIAASDASGQKTVLIIGSQSILGSYSEDELPHEATLSREVDIAPGVDIMADEIADLIDGAIGEGSEFDQERGYYVQGVTRSTAVLPTGWEGRLVDVHPAGRPEVTGRCLDPHDLCAAKLARFELKDKMFVSGLVMAGLIDPRLVRNRVDLVPDDEIDAYDGARAKRPIRLWLKTLEDKVRGERSAQPRQPKGAPQSSGGRFASRKRPEGDVTL